MNRIIICVLATAFLAACSEPSNVRFTNNTAAKVQTKSRSEPIFYNGKTYKLDFSYAQGSGVFDMNVSGMTSKQQKDAEAVATSSLGYFACPEGQKGRLVSQPRYANAKWQMQARCG